MNTEVTATEIMAVMDRICSQQVGKLFMVIAFYLDPALIPTIAPRLEEDDPRWEQSEEIEYHRPTGLIGRYRTVPVFTKDPTHDAELPRRTEEFVEYTFLTLLAAD